MYSMSGLNISEILSILEDNLVQYLVQSTSVNAVFDSCKLGTDKKSQIPLFPAAGFFLKIPKSNLGILSILQNGAPFRPFLLRH